MRISRFLFTVAVASILVAVPASGQDRPTKGSHFPAAEFDSTDKTAYYFWQYDSFAWHASDKVAADADAIGKDVLDRLGSEWFCFKTGSTWHAVFGRFHDSTDTYDAVLHYVSTPSGAIVRTTEPVNTSLGNRFGRALSIAQRHVPEGLARANIRFNSYVRERNDGGVDVLLIPSWQQNGWILYGSEFQYGFDAAGRNVRDSVVRIGNIKGARPDSTATIMLAHDEAPGIPTVGEVLFIRLYTKYFAHVYVRTRDWVSELYKGPPEMAWIHALREDKSKQGQ